MQIIATLPEVARLASDHDPGLGEAVGDLAVEEFVPEHGVQAFIIAVLSLAAEFNEP